MVAAPEEVGFVLLGLVVLAIAAYLGGILWGNKKDRGFSVVATVVAVGVVALMVASYGSAARNSGFGKPATSLEPGTYYVHDVVWSSANNTDGYPSATFLLDEQPPGERGESLSEPVSVGKNLKLVQLKIYEFLIELECGSDGYCDAVPGWYELESVTRCTDSFCATRLEFTRLTEKKH